MAILIILALVPVLVAAEKGLLIPFLTSLINSIDLALTNALLWLCHTLQDTLTAFAVTLTATVDALAVWCNDIPIEVELDNVPVAIRFSPPTAAWVDVPTVEPIREESVPSDWTYSTQSVDATTTVYAVESLTVSEPIVNVEANITPTEPTVITMPSKQEDEEIVTVAANGPSLTDKQRATLQRIRVVQEQQMEAMKRDYPDCIPSEWVNVPKLVKVHKQNRQSISALVRKGYLVEQPSFSGGTEVKPVA